MQKLICYYKGPIWDGRRLPTYLKGNEAAPPSSLAKLHVLHGRLELGHDNRSENVNERYQLIANERSPFIELEKTYPILSASEDICCQLEFYCAQDEYTQKKYGMTKTHSEVVAAMPLIKGNRVLDLGCGSGRNALYVHKLGYHVTALDKSNTCIERLKAICSDENLIDFQASSYDINQASLVGQYDFIFSTVVMMFLNPSRVPTIIQNMQAVTKKSGYNLIVSAMSTPDHPCNVPFSFTFKSGELKQYYQGWHIEKYNENIGTLHRKDEMGNRIKLRFATLLARKKE